MEDLPADDRSFSRHECQVLMHDVIVLQARVVLRVEDEVVCTGPRLHTAAKIKPLQQVRTSAMKSQENLTRVVR
jgi:hypothetical protein